MHTTLLEDDEPTINEVCQMVPESKACEVISASNAVEAKDRFARRIPDLILTD